MAEKNNVTVLSDVRYDDPNLKAVMNREVTAVFVSEKTGVSQKLHDLDTINKCIASGIKGKEDINKQNIIVWLAEYCSSRGNGKSIHSTCLMLWLICLIENGYFGDPDLANMLQMKTEITSRRWTVEAAINFFTGRSVKQNVFLRLQKTGKGRNAETVTFLFNIGTSRPCFRAELINSIKRKWPRSSGLDTRQILRRWDESLPDNVYSFEDLTADTYVWQIRYFAGFGFTDFSIISDFYYNAVFNLGYNILNGSPLRSQSLLRPQFAGYIADGFEPVVCRGEEAIPKSDKVIVIYDNKDVSNNLVNASASKAANFATVQDSEYRMFLKYYFFRSADSLTSKFRNLSPIRLFLNYLTEKQRELNSNASASDQIGNEFTPEMIMMYRQHCMRKYKRRTAVSMLSSACIFVRFLNAHGYIHVDDTLFDIFQIKRGNQSESNAHMIPREHLKLIAEKMRSNADHQTDIFYSISYLALYILYETELRPKEVFSLRYDCVQPAFSSDKFVIRTRTKTNGMEYINSPITMLTKRQIDEIVRITKPCRDECPIEGLQDMLFLYPGKTRKYATLSGVDFNNYLAAICKSLGLPVYTCSNLRDTHMTIAQELEMRGEISHFETGVLTGHQDSQSDLAYQDKEHVIRMALECTYNIIIGNVDLKGKVAVERPSDLTNSDAVENGCGYCHIGHCENFTYLSCLMCKDFVATADCIPFFKRQIAVLDERLKVADMPHEIESLNDLKRLHAAYLEKLELADSNKGGDNHD